MSNKDILIKKAEKIKSNFFLRIPNNEEGNLFYALLKKYTNTESYTYIRRGNGKDRKKNGGDRYNMPIKNCESFRVYLTHKETGAVIGYRMADYVADLNRQLNEALRKLYHAQMALENIQKAIDNVPDM